VLACVLQVVCSERDSLIRGGKDFDELTQNRPHSSAACHRGDGVEARPPRYCLRPHNVKRLSTMASFQASYRLTVKDTGQIALNSIPMTEIHDVTCHMGSHSATCYPTQVNAPRPKPYPQAGTRFTNLGDPAMERPGVELVTSRSQVRHPNHYITQPSHSELSSLWQILTVMRKRFRRAEK